MRGALDHLSSLSYSLRVIRLVLFVWNFIDPFLAFVARQVLFNVVVRLNLRPWRPVLATGTRPCPVRTVASALWKSAQLLDPVEHGDDAQFISARHSNYREECWVVYNIAIRLHESTSTVGPVQQREYKHPESVCSRQKRLCTKCSKCNLSSCLSPLPSYEERNE